MLQSLLTEAPNPASSTIDSLPTSEMLGIINAADLEVAAAVQSQIPDITRAVDEVVLRMQQGGRLFYIGAGTSGRLGVLDASECPPTFNTPPELVHALIAGGDRALRRAVENAEDDPEAGRKDLQQVGLTPHDAVVGIAASGRTPYVLGALAYARSVGALTIAISCTERSELAAAADIAISPTPGPEIVTGSTRMRAGTATKLVLNMLSTATMIKLGYVYGNLMVNVQPTNHKLTDRARRIIAEITGVSDEKAAELLSQGGSVKTAVVMNKLGLTRIQAEARLKKAAGHLRSVLEDVTVATGNQ